MPTQPVRGSMSSNFPKVLNVRVRSQHRGGDPGTRLLSCVRLSPCVGGVFIAPENFKGLSPGGLAFSREAGERFAAVLC